MWGCVSAFAVCYGLSLSAGRERFVALCATHYVEVRILHRMKVDNETQQVCSLNELQQHDSLWITAFCKLVTNGFGVGLA